MGPPGTCNGRFQARKGGYDPRERFFPPLCTTPCTCLYVVKPRRSPPKSLPQRPKHCPRYIQRIDRGRVSGCSPRRCDRCSCLGFAWVPGMVVFILQSHAAISPESEITTFFLGLPLPSCPIASICLTTSSPCTTFPKTTCLPSSLKHHVNRTTGQQNRQPNEETERTRQTVDAGTTQGRQRNCGAAPPPCRHA